MKRMISSILAAAALLLVSCREDKPLYEPESILNVVHYDLLFQPNGGSGSITVESASGLEVTPALAWCHATVNGNTVSVTVDPHYGIETRYCRIDLKAGDSKATLVAQQSGIISEPFKADNIYIGNEAKTVSFPYKANGSLLASSDADWISFANEGNNFIVNIAGNTGKVYRSATVNWQLGGQTGSFEVAQFDPKENNITGEWDWASINMNSGRSYPLTASLNETPDGYALALSARNIAWTVPVTFEGPVMKMELGVNVGTFKSGSSTYSVFLTVGKGENTATSFDKLCTKGTLDFFLKKDASGHFTATDNLAAYEEAYSPASLRFEMWATSDHPEDSKSRIVLNQIVLTRK